MTEPVELIITFTMAKMFREVMSKTHARMNWMMIFVILSWKKQNNCQCGVSAAGVAVDDEDGKGWRTGAVKISKIDTF